MSAAEAASGSAIEFGPCGARSDPVVRDRLSKQFEIFGANPSAASRSRDVLHRGKNEETKKFLLGAHPPPLSSRAGDAPNMAQLAQTTQAALSGQSKTVTVTVMGTSLVQTLVLLP